MFGPVRGTIRARRTMHLRRRARHGRDGVPGRRDDVPTPVAALSVTPVLQRGRLGRKRWHRGRDRRSACGTWGPGTSGVCGGARADDGCGLSGRGAAGTPARGERPGRTGVGGAASSWSCWPGLVVAWARPRNSIGWLLGVAVFLQTASLVGGAYAQASYVDGSPGPGAFFGAWVAAWAWFPSLAMPVAVLPSIYPSGRPQTRGRRVLVVAGVVGIVGLCATLALGPDAPGEAVPGLTSSLPQPPPWADAAVLGTTAVALALAVVGGLSAATVRAFRATAPERQQMLWLLVALWPYAGGYFFRQPLWWPGYAFVGVAVAVGILRELGCSTSRSPCVARSSTRLFIALVALVVAGVSTAIARVAPEGPLPLIGSAVIVAVLVGPVSGRLRRAVDRFALGERADPVSAVGRVAGRGERTASDPVSSVLEALVDAVGVEYAAVQDTGGRPLLEIGRETGGPLCDSRCARGVTGWETS